jgi:acyl carrier protein
LESSAIYAKLVEVVHDVFDDDTIVLTPELTADQVDGWDSLAHIRLMLAVEKAFGIRIAAAEVGKLKNVGELVALIHAKAH